ncbi:hypothetical protein MUK42_18227 [Musa troglodytarum]|uniref:Uncharacterized protein n=1 Tax=Musa troglodytarum TaxID=320322 RepID=A0A9E7H2I8_9LILI|nr:hypothetical protein MUK42_18227 [Musa troglodytarum]
MRSMGAWPADYGRDGGRGEGRVGNAPEEGGDGPPSRCLHSIARWLRNPGRTPRSDNLGSARDPRQAGETDPRASLPPRDVITVV